MKNSKWILALWLGTSAWAQTPAAKPPVTPPAAAKAAPATTAAPTPAKPTPAQAAGKGTIAPKPTAAKPGASRANAKKQVTASLRPTAATPALVSTAKPATGRRTHRDPFVSPIVERVQGSGPVCSGTGKRCLVVGEITLHGVVHSANGYIAVVMNGEHTYFLHEHDPLANGTVERITGNSIVLHEHSTDVLGRPVSREVTKKLGVPPV